MGMTYAALIAGKGFQPNLQDPRFKSLFTSADYALDPTDPRFQQIDGSKSIAKEVATQRQHHAADQPADTGAVAPASNGHQELQTKLAAELGALPEAQNSAQLKSMIASLKRKSSKNSQAASVIPKASDKKAKKKKQRIS